MHREGATGKHPLLRGGRSALAIKRQFGLKEGPEVAGDRYKAEQDLVTTIQAYVSEEIDGNPISSNVQSTIFLFETQLCIENQLLPCVPAPLLGSRKVVPLAEVLGLTARATAADVGVAPNSTEELRTFDLQMRGRSLQITMGAELSRNFSRDVEDARMKASDLSLKGSRSPRRLIRARAGAMAASHVAPRSDMALAHRATCTA